MAVTPLYPYELTGEQGSTPVDSLKSRNHGPPEDPPLSLHPLMR